MDYPTISEYTEHLRLDKASLRNYLTAAGISTQESDTFTELVQAALAANGALRCIYVQPDEPLGKDGIWIKRSTAVVDFDAVSDPQPYVHQYFSDVMSTLAFPTLTNYKIKMHNLNNNIYLMRYRSAMGTGADILTENTNVITFFKYNKTNNSWTEKQSYTYNEVISVRGEAYTTAASPTLLQKLNIDLSDWAIDDNENYVYLWGGQTVYNITGYGRVEAKKITRFGFSSHSKTFIRNTTYAYSNGTNMSRLFLYNNTLFGFGFTSWTPYPSDGRVMVASLSTTNPEDTQLLSIGNCGNGGFVCRQIDNDRVVCISGSTQNFNGGPDRNKITVVNLSTRSQVKFNKLTVDGGGAIWSQGDFIYFTEESGDRAYYCADLTTNTVTRLTNIGNYDKNVLGFKQVGCIIDSVNNTVLYYSSQRSTTNQFTLNLLDNTYTNPTVVLYQTSYAASKYRTNLYTTNQFLSDLKYSFNDAWYYNPNTGYEKTLPVYYGDGTQWIKFKN